MSARLAARGSLAALSLFAAGCPGVGHAESLLDAIRLAYQTDPTLRAQQAALRAVDEGYVQALASAGPQVSVNGQYSYQSAQVRQSQLFFGTTTTDYHAANGSADLSLVQPIYSSGAISAQVHGAADSILVSREQLRQAESQLLQKVVTAYVDVRRDRETVRTLDAEISVLGAEFAEIKARAEHGVLSKTDVDQSEARLLSAQAQRNLALGRLNVSGSEYLSVVGQNPGELEPEPDLPGVPGKVDEAFDAADQNNPQILGAIADERAAREKVNQAKSATGPTVSIRLDAQTQPVEPYLPQQYARSLSAAAVVTQPIYTAGMNSSKVREAQENDNRAQLNIEAARRAAVQQVAQAWDQLISTRNAIAIEQRQLDVEGETAKGYRIEEKVGLRSTIDLLNGELELTDTRLSLLQSKHDEYVARASLLAAMGLLEARYLTPGLQTFSPEHSLKRVTGGPTSPLKSAVTTIDSFGAGPSVFAPRLSAPGAGSTRPPANPDPPTPTP